MNFPIALNITFKYQAEPLIYSINIYHDVLRGKMEEDQRECPNCGTILEEGEVECPSCGESFIDEDEVL